MVNVNLIWNDEKPRVMGLEKAPSIGEELLITWEGKPCHLKIERMVHQLEDGKEKTIMLYCKELEQSTFDIFALT